MNKLTYTNNTYNSNNIKTFKPIREFQNSSIEKSFDFAYNMSFGEEGEHRNHRSGGNNKRTIGQIFANTFQGKLAEFGIYHAFHSKNIEIPYPDLETYKLGLWDKYDFIVNNKKIAVKSTKYYGNLLLLETKDWNNKGQYIPNLNTENAEYDYIIFTRISPSIEKLVKHKRLFYSSTLSPDKYNDLKNSILNKIWKYDIPGYISHCELIQAITNKFILPKDSTLGKDTKMDAENYYIQTGDMHSIDELFKLI